MSMIINTLINETRKGLIILWDYKANIVIQMISIFLILVGIMFFVGRGEITQDQMKSTILGFIVTYYAMETIGNMSWALMAEAQAGTLEQMYLSPAPSQIIILGRSFASLIAATAQIIPMTIILLLIFNITLPMPLSIIPIMLVTIVGLLGFGYIVGGLTLIFKQIGPLANIIQNFILIGNGTFLPVHFMPAWIAGIMTLFPSTLGIILMRRVTLEGYSLSTLLSDGSFAWLTLHSVVFFIVGWIIFAMCDHVARTQGSLGQY